MKKPRLLIALASLVAVPALAQTIATADLGALQLDYVRVSASGGYTGSPLAARVSFRPGDALSLVSPHRIQRIHYLVNPGDTVAAGQPIAELSGPEIHHFITEYKVVGERYAVAKKRFESNRALYQRKAIDESRWIEISDAYYMLQLEYEHLDHFRERLIEDAPDPDRILFTTPAAGRLLYALDMPGIAEGGEIAVIVPEEALRLQVAVPTERGAGLAQLRGGQCELAVDGISAVAEGFYRRAWSAPLTADCQWLPGQQVMVTPWYQRAGYVIPRGALLHWQGDPAVLIRSDEQLQLVPVEVLSTTAEGYVVSCSAPLADREVLASSVSAVQGIMLGLGGD